MIAVVCLGYISATSVHLALCWSCLRSGKATLLGLYGVFITIVRCYADRLRAVKLKFHGTDSDTDRRHRILVRKCHRAIGGDAIRFRGSDRERGSSESAITLFNSDIHPTAFRDVPYRTDPRLRSRPPMRPPLQLRANQRAAPGHHAGPVTSPRHRPDL